MSDDPFKGFLITCFIIIFVLTLVLGVWQWGETLAWLYDNIHFGASSNETKGEG